MKNKKIKIPIIVVLSILVLVFAGVFTYYKKTLKPYMAFEKDIEDFGQNRALDIHYPISEEELAEQVPYSKSQAEYIKNLPSYNKSDSWVIYLYMCGSDLESNNKDDLSVTTNFELYSKNNNFYENNNDIETFQRIKDILNKNNLQLPQSFYENPKKNMSELNGSEEEESYEDYGEEQRGVASEELMDITTTPLPENVKFIIQTGGSKSWSYPGVSPNRIQRWLYDSNGMKEIYSGELENMGDQEGLESFLDFVKKYDADHKAFIFWNHGAGSFGAEQDEIYNDILSLKEIKNAFGNNFNVDNNNPPFELLCFNACLMGSSEAANAFSGIAKYYVASEDLQLGGWKDYKWVEALANNPGMNGAQLGKVMVDSYLELATQCQNLFQDHQMPNHLGVYDLTKAGAVYEEYARLIGKILKDAVTNPKVLANLSNASGKSIRYAASDYDYYNTCDLGIFMEELKQYYPEAQKVIDLLNDAVLYTRGKGHNEYSKGLSVYFPTNINNLYSLFKAMDYIDNVTENNDIKALYLYKSLGCVDDNTQNYLKHQGLNPAVPINTELLKELSDNVIFEQSGKEEYFKISINPEYLSYIQDMKLVVGKYDYETDKVTYFGEKPVKNFEVKNDGRWLMINNDILFLELIESNDKYNRYKSPVKINGVENYIVIMEDLVNKRITISGIKEKDLPADTLDRVVKDLVEGDKIVPLLESTTGKWLKENVEEGSVHKYKGGENLIKSNLLPDEKYLQYVELTDIRGNKFNTPVIEFEIRNGKVVNQKINDLFEIIE